MPVSVVLMMAALCLLFDNRMGAACLFLVFLVGVK
jgi:hypothetical protein